MGLNHYCSNEYYALAKLPQYLDNYGYYIIDVSNEKCYFIYGVPEFTIGTDQITIPGSLSDYNDLTYSI